MSVLANQLANNLNTFQQQMQEQMAAEKAQAKKEREESEARTQNWMTQLASMFQGKGPMEQLWTAQAEASSVLCASRLAQLRGWEIGTMDVKGAFMQALKSSIYVKKCLKA